MGAVFVPCAVEGPVAMINCYERNMVMKLGVGVCGA